MKIFNNIWKRLGWSFGGAAVMAEIPHMMSGDPKAGKGTLPFWFIGFFALITLIQYLAGLYQMNKEIRKKDSEEEEILDNN